MAVTIHKDNEATLITGQALEDLVRKIILSAAEEISNKVDPVKLKHTLIQLMRDGATSEQANSLGLEKGDTLAMITEAVARVLIRDHDWGAEDLNQIKIYANSGDNFFDPSTIDNFKKNGIFRHSSAINIDGQLIADERKRISGL